MADTVSVDEFMSKRRAHVGKANDGHEVVFKGFKAPPSFNAEERSAEFVMSSERIDRDGDIVRQKGLGLGEFKKNPQGLLFHSSRTWPVGSWSDVKKDLKAEPPTTAGKFNFLPAGGPVEVIDQAFWMVQHGAIRTVSIGFMPLELEIIEHKNDESPWGYGYDILKSELYECSLVPIPAQPDAVAKDLVARGEMGPAKEFIEQALDEWARDPRTGMLIPKEELKAVYKSYFGKSAGVVMAVDSYMETEKTALVRADKAIREALEERGIKAPILEVQDPPVDGNGEVEAISGIQIHINISQDGGTGGNTRTGTDVGDTGTAAADAGAQGAGASQRSISDVKDPPAAPKRKLVDALWRRFFGEEKVPPEPALSETKIIPGSFKAREAVINAMDARLRAME